MQDAKHIGAGSRRLAPYSHALSLIDAHLARTNPDDEEEKINRAMVLMFGPDPIGFTSSPPIDRQTHDASPSDPASPPLP